MKVLATDLLRHTRKVSRAYGSSTVPLGPAQISGPHRAPLIDSMSRGTFQPLHESGKLGRRMKPDQQVQVRGHDAEFQQATAFLPDDDGEVLCEI